MKFSALTLSSLILLSTLSAQARPLPNPPPSGVVVHLFGPGSIASNMIPDALPAAGTSSGPSVQSPGGYIAPSAGTILHQMFVTGDPNANPQGKLAKGRMGNH